MKQLRLSRDAVRCLNRRVALIRCIDDQLLVSVTRGKAYRVKEVDHDYYLFDDDLGIETAVHKSRFESVLWR